VLKCQYCNQAAKLVDGTVIYPHRPDLSAKKFWNCENCGAYVGCHPRTERPLGTLANKRLRQLRSQVHAHFDPLWRDGGLSRGAAYNWLRHKMGLTADECHTAKFDETQCYVALSHLTNRVSVPSRGCTVEAYLNRRS